MYVCVLFFFYLGRSPKIDIKVDYKIGLRTNLVINFDKRDRNDKRKVLQLR